MKKIVAAVITTFALTAGASEFAELTYNPSIKNETTMKVTGDGLGLVLGTTQFKFVTVDGKFDTTRARTNGVLSNDAQARGTFSLPLWNYGTAYARGGIGRSFNTGNDYNFYTYAGGARVNLVNDFNLQASVERNNAMKAGNPKFTTYEAGIGYSITKKDDVKVVYQRSKGDLNTSGFQLGYARAF